MFNKSHSDESKLIMSQMKIGKLRSLETKLKISLTNSRKVFILSANRRQDEKIKIKHFNSYSEAAEYLNCSIRTISRYIDKNKLYKKNFFFYSVKISLSAKNLF